MEKTNHTKFLTTSSHCWLEQGSNCQQSWPENNYMVFIPITIPEIAASTFFPVTVWTPGGTAIIFAQIGILS